MSHIFDWNDDWCNKLYAAGFPKDWFPTASKLKSLIIEKVGEYHLLSSQIYMDDGSILHRARLERKDGSTCLISSGYCGHEVESLADLFIKIQNFEEVQMTWEKDFEYCAELLSELYLDDDSYDDAIDTLWSCNDKDDMIKVYRKYEREYDIEEE